MTVISVNIAGLTALAEKLQAMPAASEETFTEGLEECGELVAAEARRRSNYSSKIPGSIHTEVAGPGLVRVSTQLREAVAIENKGKGHVRHPLFGTREHWYTKNSHPAFLHPALVAKQEAFRAIAIQTVYEAFEAVGMSVEAS